MTPSSGSIACYGYIGFFGFWVPNSILTAEIYPTRIRGLGNGFTWAVAWLVGFVLWPSVTVY
jgi:putative MFS transporter